MRLNGRARWRRSSGSHLKGWPVVAEVAGERLHIVRRVCEAQNVVLDYLRRFAPELGLVVCLRGEMTGSCSNMNRFMVLSLDLLSRDKIKRKCCLGIRNRRYHRIGTYRFFNLSRRTIPLIGKSISAHVLPIPLRGNRLDAIIVLTVSSPRISVFEADRRNASFVPLNIF